MSLPLFTKGFPLVTKVIPFGYQSLPFGNQGPRFHSSIYIILKWSVTNEERRRTYGPDAHTYCLFYKYRYIEGRGHEE